MSGPLQQLATTNTRLRSGPNTPDSHSANQVRRTSRIKIFIKSVEYSSQSQTKPRKLEPLVHKIPMGGRNNLAGLRLPANYSGEASDVLT